MFKILLFCMMGGFIGVFLYHGLRYGHREAWRDLKFCVSSIVSDILSMMFNLFHAKPRCHFCKSLATKSARLYVGTKPLEEEGFVKWDYADISFGDPIHTCDRHFIELAHFEEDIKND